MNSLSLSSSSSCSDTFLQVLKSFLITMVKSEIYKKQSKASGSAHPTGFESTIRDQSPSIAQSNYRVIFEDHLSYNEAIKLMTTFLPKHALYGAFDSFTEAFPMAIMFKCAFSAFRPSHNYQEIHLNLVVNSFVVLLRRNSSQQPTYEFIYLPSSTPQVPLMCSPLCIKWVTRRSSKALESSRKINFQLFGSSFSIS